MNIIWGLLIACFVSWGLTGLLRNYALAKKIIDVPNERSSHVVPTPRGGGLAIVLTFLTSLLIFLQLGLLPENYFWALLGSGGCIALIGFLDDHGHIPARWRLLVHFVGAGWVVSWFGGIPHVSIFGTVLDFNWLGNVVAVMYLVWVVNLYNFMDGINGIAGIEAVTVCLGGIILYAMSTSNDSMWLAPMVLLASVAGFLFWNFPKAKVFMGDVGSGFIGIVLGSFSIYAGWLVSDLFWGWLILLGAFVVDATVTLVRRVWRGDRFYEAHNCHAYQNASKRYGSHVPVAVAFGVINIFWLLPIAVFVVAGWMEGAVGVAIAYAPLVWLAFKYNAGARELQEE